MTSTRGIDPSTRPPARHLLSIGLDQPLGDERLDVLATGRVEPVPAEDEIRAVALETKPSLGHVVDPPVGLVESKRPGGDLRVAGQRIDEVDVRLDRQKEMAGSRL